MIFQSMKMAWHAVVSNKLRSFLTMLGIIIGVVALIVLVSIANGATSSVTDQISSMGSSYLTVTITDIREIRCALRNCRIFVNRRKWMKWLRFPGPALPQKQVIPTEP